MASLPSITISLITARDFFSPYLRCQPLEKPPLVIAFFRISKLFRDGFPLLRFITRKSSAFQGLKRQKKSILFPITGYTQFAVTNSLVRPRSRRARAIDRRSTILHRSQPSANSVDDYRRPLKGFSEERTRNEDRTGQGQSCPLIITIRVFTRELVYPILPVEYDISRPIFTSEKNNFTPRILSIYSDVRSLEFFLVKREKRDIPLGIRSIPFDIGEEEN